MATARAVFQAHVDGLFPESLPFDAQWTSSNAVGATTITTLANGDNTITIPASALNRWILFVPPNNTTATMKLKLVGGDSGIPMWSTIPQVWSFNTATFIINVTAGPVTNAVFTFF